MQKIPLTQGKYAYVDDDDAHEIRRHKWQAFTDGHNWYACRGGTGAGGKKRTLYMHRVILEARKGERVDHADGNGLNNQRANLRLCTHAQNMRNRKKHRNNTSGYTGVCKKGNSWTARIKHNGKIMHIGSYPTAEAAAAARDQKAIELHGEYASLNSARTRKAST